MVENAAKHPPILLFHTAFLRSIMDTIVIHHIRFSYILVGNLFSKGELVMLETLAKQINQVAVSITFFLLYVPS